MAALNPYPSTSTAAWANQPLEFNTGTATIDWPTFEQVYGWSVPTRFEIVSLAWQMPRLDFDRLHLARVAGAAVVPPRPLRALVADRTPNLVRRAPRPAGRPYGWRRARKGGRRT